MIILLELVNVAVFLLVAAVVVTQVILPLVQGRPLLSMLRGGKSRSQRRLEDAQRRVDEARDLKAAAEQELEAARLEIEATRLRAEALTAQIDANNEVATGGDKCKDRT